jgi:aminoglycoside phosphotransferase (APT) family kinase protein
MQPEPPFYLRGVRRELLRQRSIGGRPDDRAFVGAMERCAETLIQIAVRLEALPEILNSVLAEQRALLSDTLALARAAGIPSLAAAEAALALENEGLLGEAVIQRYDRLSSIQSELLAAMSEREPTAMDVARVAPRAAAFERTVRDAINAQLLEMREAELRVMGAFGEPEPTAQDVTAYIRFNVPSEPDLRAIDVRRQMGVNTKEIFFIALAGGKNWPAEAVLRRNRKIDSVGNNVSDEFELLKVLHGAGLPVPCPLAAGESSPQFKRPFLLTGRVPGRTEAVAALGEATGGVFSDMARFLAKLHSLPSGSIRGRPHYGVEVKERTLTMIARFYKSWKADLYQPSLTLEASFAWLRANVGRLSEGRAWVHGDYNLRNILIHEGRISGVLDWELAHEGHPAEDLGYCRPQVEEVMNWSDFLATYEAAGGSHIDDFDVRYFQIYGMAFGVSSIFPACNGYLKSRHDDILIGAAGFIEYPTNVATLEKLLQEEYARG